MVALSSGETGSPEQCLKRLVRRIAMMLQAEKCVFLLHDRERNELAACPPALGLSLSQVCAFRLPPNRGVSAAVFSACEPIIVCQGDPCDPLDAAWMQRFRVRNFLVYPLVNHIPFGVLHIINKRGKAEFTEADLHLLSVMGRQVSNAIKAAKDREL